MDYDDLLMLDLIEAVPDDPDRRLVYADWLEELGDRRCLFLRNELLVEAVAAKQDRKRLKVAVNTLRNSGVNLNGEWKSRVVRYRAAECLLFFMQPERKGR
jgi:uncharacterized protein (TIGR02996 family)